MKNKKIFSILLTAMLLAGTLLLSSVTAFADGGVEMPIVPLSEDAKINFIDLAKNSNNEIVIRFHAYVDSSFIKNTNPYFVVTCGDYTSDHILVTDCGRDDNRRYMAIYTLKDTELEEKVGVALYKSNGTAMHFVEKTAKEVAEELSNSDKWYVTEEQKQVAREVLARIEGPTKTEVAIPTAVTGLIYNGEEQTGVAQAEGYTVTGGKATAAGNYTATATLEDGYIWSDFTEESKEIQWSIENKTAVIPTAVTGLVYNGEEQTGVAQAEGYTVTGGRATAVGNYTATATLEDGYVWSDKTTTPKNIEWSIDYAVAPALAGFNNTGIQSITDENGIGTMQFGWTLTFEGSVPTSLGALIINWDAFNPEIVPELPQESELIPMGQPNPVELSKANPNINSGEIFFARLTDIPAGNTETITAYPTVNGKPYTAAKLSGTVSGTIVWVEEEAINE